MKRATIAEARPATQIGTAWPGPTIGPAEIGHAGGRLAFAWAGYEGLIGYEGLLGKR
jgi:hypothetical protein